MKLAVTTPLHPSPAEETAARAAAARHGLAFAARGHRSLEAARRAAGVDALLVLSARHAAIVVDGEERRWSPGMGALRAKRVAAGAAGGPPDPFLAAAGIGAGDAVLDCTLGLGADALVAAVAVGPAGRVVGLEASRRSPPGSRRTRALTRRPAVEIRAGDHAAALAALPERSFDVVLFDPMFRHARAEPAGFDLVRLLADPRPLSPAALERARRVARRWVLVKDGAPGWDLTRLGLVPLPSARGAHRYYARVPAA
jgi:hypothetical protein